MTFTSPGEPPPPPAFLSIRTTRGFSDRLSASLPRSWRPSWPVKPSPNEYTLPAAVRTSVCQAPHATDVARKSASGSGLSGSS